MPGAYDLGGTGEEGGRGGRKGEGDQITITKCQFGLHHLNSNNETNVCITFIADFCSMMSDLMNSTDRRAPGCEKKTLELAAQQQSLNTLDFDKKFLAFKGILYICIFYNYFKSNLSVFVSSLYSTVSTILSSVFLSYLHSTTSTVLPSVFVLPPLHNV